MQETIQLMYSCRLCGLHRIKINVPARLESQIVTEWLDDTVRRVGQDHNHKSPNCRATELTELMIPVDNVKFIGAPISPKIQ